MQAYKPHAASAPLGFRRLPLGAAFAGHESPAPPADAAAAAGAAAVAPCRLVRFDGLATPRLQYPLGPRLPGSAGAAAGAVLPQQLQYSGVFVCGPRPLWLVAARGGLLVHPADGELAAVDAFCAFHNVNCPHGYIAASLEGRMNICTLPLQVLAAGVRAVCCCMQHRNARMHVESLTIAHTAVAPCRPPACCVHPACIHSCAWTSPG